MNDREMLEMAAKAIGGELLKTTGGYPYWAAFKGVPPGPWNPLEDDAEALRLAIRLKISFYADSGDAVVTWYTKGPHPMSEGSESYAEEIVDDPMIAARRAIVHAAAEIGRTMK